jgi:tyrosyl-tRNA synthetase
MSIPDEAMDEYFRLLLGAEGRPDGPPNLAKRELGRRIVDRFHGDGSGAGAEAAFDKVFVQHSIPDDIPVVDLADYTNADDGMVHLPRLIAGAFGLSSSEARRLISQGGVKLSAEQLTEPLDVPAEALAERILQVGKRRFARLQNSD